MFRDPFDRISWLLFFVAAISMLYLFIGNGGGGSEKQAAGKAKALERQLAYLARVELISKIFAPVDDLKKEGKHQTALLKLDELIRKYPAEAHGHILQGEILFGMGAIDEAISSYMSGVKLNGDYVDAKSPLSRREEIQRLVEAGLKNLAQRASADPGNRTVSAARQKVNYLKSRLAGGCE